MKKSRSLTEREERFVVEYATSGNGKQAALNAGYKPKIAAVMACRILKKKEVVAVLNKIKMKDLKKLELTRENVLMELAKGLFRDPVGLENSEGFVVTSLKDIPQELRTIIDGFKVTQQLDEDGNPVSQKIEVKLVPKAAVIDMGMKHLGAYSAEKQEQKVSVDWDSLFGRPVIIDEAENAIKQVKGDV
jgi:hypothetical protein